MDILIHKNMAANHSLSDSSSFNYVVDKNVVPSPLLVEDLPTASETINVMGTVTMVITRDDVRRFKYLSFLTNSYYKNNEAILLEDNEDVISNIDYGPKIKSRNVFFKISTRDGQELICNSVDHFPVQKHDIVFGQAQTVLVQPQYHYRTGSVINSGGTYYQFTFPPAGLAGTSKDAFYNNLHRYSNGRIKGKIATDVYNRLISMNNSKEIISEAMELKIAFQQMSKLAEATKDINSPLNDGHLGSIFDSVSLSTCRTLFKNWYWHYLRRRIELLGVERRTIGEMIKLGYTLTVIYEKLRRDAFTLLPLPMEDAIALKKKMGQSYTPFDREVAIRARKIYHKIRNDVWTCVPDDFHIHVAPAADVVDWSIELFRKELTDKYDMIHDLGSLYFKYHYDCEVLVADRLVAAQMNIEPLPLDDLTFVNSRIQELTAEQVNTVRNTLASPISIVTGGAGTGKTTIIEQMCENLSRLNLSYAIAAFTGKAVARIKQGIKTQIKPMTIHCLCYGGWERMMTDLGLDVRPFDCLIVDEASMVTISMLAMVYGRFSHDFRLILVGDNKQLAPIEWGYLYKEVQKAKVFSANLLTQNLRVLADKEEDGIVLNTDRIATIIEGDLQVGEKLNLLDRQLPRLPAYVSKLPYSTPSASTASASTSYTATLPSSIQTTSSLPLKEGKDMAIVPNRDLLSMTEMNSIESSALAELAESNRRNFHYTVSSNFKLTAGGMDNVRFKLQQLIDEGVDSRDIVILSPFNKYIDDLNRIGQEVCLIDRSEPFFSRGRTFFKHDIVVMTRNDYGVDIMNGTSGEIIDFELNNNNHRMKQVELHTPTKIILWRKKRKIATPIIETGYVQIRFVTDETTRFFLNEDDYKIYRWCLGVLPCLTIGDPNRKNYLPNSSEEWEKILTTINRSYQYYIKYSHSAAQFANSSIFTSAVQRIFEPLLYVKRHYGYMGDITHGYAMTVHKSQGSQWAHVIPYLDHHTKASRFLNNTLLYTMLTRAERTVSCIGNSAVFYLAALQAAPIRYDRLAVRIQSLIIGTKQDKE